jgi:hypothetical protein
VVLTINGVDRIYQLNRANNHIDHDQLVVHVLPPGHSSGSLAGLPDFGYVSPLSSGGYPTLTPALQTSGLQSPDAIMGSVPLGSTTAVIYVEKQLGVDASLGFPVCPSTPPFALTNLVNRGKARGANDDVTTVRVATTTDGLNFQDVGPASGLFDPTTTALNGTRYLGSGSIGVVAFLIWSWRSTGNIGTARWTVRFPSGPMVLLQIGLGIVDLGATALAMYVLIPVEMNIGMFHAIAVFIAGMLLGFASHAPAGLGAFDATILVGLGDPDREEPLIAALLIFRFLYHLLPFVLALALFGGVEGWRSSRARA